MEQVDIAALEPVAISDASARRELTGPLDTSEIPINQYRLPLGDGLPGRLHTHIDQEEVFVILAGTATSEDKPDILRNAVFQIFDTMGVGRG